MSDDERTTSPPRRSGTVSTGQLAKAAAPLWLHQLVAAIAALVSHSPGFGEPPGHWRRSRWPTARSVLPPSRSPQHMG
ncbi:hypothetical protein [Nakamurella aerolata]|uniref:Uncharacterized protein n=1 Tax=Nakamurella aerolata TaxID=1656892 RepID=A0A849A967_9ACTN|nr:hypothetical protein [Nakamurella aerolata]NNG36156.1 hypothetical protein [Nakamurella aerolata]